MSDEREQLRLEIPVLEQKQELHPPRIGNFVELGTPAAASVEYLRGKRRGAGRRPDVINALEVKMRAYVAEHGRQALADMSHEVLLAEFGRSKTSCRRCRDRILANLANLANSG